MTRAKPYVSLYCDGSCSPRGTRAWHGGWAAILVFGDLEKVVTGHSYPETNSTMELKALLGGLQVLKRPCQIEVYCDAKYVVDGTNDWLGGWLEKKWRGRAGKIDHRDLWIAVAEHKRIHNIHCNWIRGHSKKDGRSHHQEYNVRCDELAEEEAWKSYREVTGEKA